MIYYKTIKSLSDLTPGFYLASDPGQKLEVKTVVYGLDPPERDDLPEKELLSTLTGKVVWNTTKYFNVYNHSSIFRELHDAEYIMEIETHPCILDKTSVIVNRTTPSKLFYGIPTLDENELISQMIKVVAIHSKDKSAIDILISCLKKCEDDLANLENKHFYQEFKRRFGLSVMEFGIVAIYKYIITMPKIDLDIVHYLIEKAILPSNPSPRFYLEIEYALQENPNEELRVAILNHLHKLDLNSTKEIGLYFLENMMLDRLNFACYDLDLELSKNLINSIIQTNSIDQMYFAANLVYKMGFFGEVSEIILESFPTEEIDRILYNLTNKVTSCGKLNSYEFLMGFIRSYLRYHPSKSDVSFLFRAIAFKDGIPTFFIKFLVDNGANPNYENASILRKALNDNSLELVDYLLESGANPNLIFDLKTSKITRPWINKLSNEIVDSLLRAGLDLNIDSHSQFWLLVEKNIYFVKAISSVNKEGISHSNLGLLIAHDWHLQSHHEEIEFLIDKVEDITAEDDLVLRTAISHRCPVHLVEKIIDKGANVGCKGNLPIKIAAELGFVEVIGLLVERGADYEVDSNYPIRIAAKYNNVEVVRFLLDLGISINVESSYLMGIAVKNSHSGLINLLKEYGAEE